MNKYAATIQKGIFFFLESSVQFPFHQNTVDAHIGK